MQMVLTLNYLWYFQIPKWYVETPFATSIRGDDYYNDVIEIVSNTRRHGGEYELLKTAVQIKISLVVQAVFQL
jgi:hypothetical protein